MKSQQSGFAHAVVIIGLIVLLLGALGFIFWQNFISDKSEADKAKGDTAKQDTVKVSVAETTDDSPAAPDGR